MTTALLIVDVQNDFMKNGSLEVPHANEILRVIDNLLHKAQIVIWTQDSHPEDHCSFKENGGPWPKHCIKDSWGWEISSHFNNHGYSSDLSDTHIILKGQNPKFDSYSAFFDDGGTPTGLSKLLKDKGVDELMICGLASEYCVKFTVLDALKEGFKVNVIMDAVQSINIDNEQLATDEMISAGAILSLSRLVIKENEES